MSAETFAEAYQAAIYKAGGLAFVLSEKPTGVVLFEGRRFAIITAHNPRSERLSEEENQKRHEQLEQDLKTLGLEHTFSTGESPDGTWVEEGFAVFDVELEQALELGRKYRQHAILWGEGEKVYLAWCETRKLEGFFAFRVYRYVGSHDIASLVKPELVGQKILKISDLINWISRHKTHALSNGLVPATFVVNLEGHLLLSDRNSEHIVCAGGKDVFSAGEVFFSDNFGVEAITNQSTGYCPEPNSFSFVSRVLEGISVQHPSQFTQEFIFRKCLKCGQTNIVKESFFVCSVCDTELSSHWNFDQGDHG